MVSIFTFSYLSSINSINVLQHLLKTNMKSIGLPCSINQFVAVVLPKVYGLKENNIGYLLL